MNIDLQTYMQNAILTYLMDNPSASITSCEFKTCNYESLGDSQVFVRVETKLVKEEEEK